VGKPVYRRILLKLSGEALMGRQAYGIDDGILAALSEEVRDVGSLGVQIALVVGGGNIFAASRPAGSTASTAPPPTTWGCSRPSSTAWRCR